MFQASSVLLRERWWYVSSEVAPACRFYYAKGMNVDEAYVFVCYDSRTDRARFTPHTGAPSLSYHFVEAPSKVFEYAGLYFSLYEADGPSESSALHLQLIYNFRLSLGQNKYKASCWPHETIEVLRQEE